MAAGADPLLKDNGGMTPLEAADTDRIKDLLGGSEKLRESAARKLASTTLMLEVVDVRALVDEVARSPELLDALDRINTAASYTPEEGFLEARAKWLLGDDAEESG